MWLLSQLIQDTKQLRISHNGNKSHEKSHITVGFILLAVSTCIAKAC